MLAHYCIGGFLVCNVFSQRKKSNILKYICLVFTWVFLTFFFSSVSQAENTYSIIQKNTQGYTVASQATPTADFTYQIQIALLNFSPQTANPPIGFSIYDSNGYLASAMPSTATYNQSPEHFSTKIILEDSIESVYLVPILRQGGEDESNKTTPFAQGELAKIQVESRGKLNLRNSPRNNSSVLSSFTSGTPVLITHRPSDEWAQVTVVKEGTSFQGYMSSQYLVPIEGLDEAFTNTENLSNHINSQNPSLPVTDAPILPEEEISSTPMAPLITLTPIQPTSTPIVYQRAFQANQQMAAGYTVTATAQEQADRPNWFTFALNLTYAPGTGATQNISLFYLYLNDEFFGVLSPIQGLQANSSSATYALNALISDQIHALSLIPVYDGWAKGAEVIPMYAVSSNVLMPSTSNQNGNSLLPPHTNSQDISTQTQPMEGLPPVQNLVKSRAYTGLQTMESGYTIYATAIEEEGNNGNYTIHAFLSFDPQNPNPPHFSMIYLFINQGFFGTLSPYDDPWNQQWQQTAPNTFELKIQITQPIESLHLVPAYENGEVSHDQLELVQDP